MHLQAIYIYIYTIEIRQAEKVTNKSRHDCFDTEGGDPARVQPCNPVPHSKVGPQRGEHVVVPDPHALVRFEKRVLV